MTAQDLRGLLCDVLRSTTGRPARAVIQAATGRRCLVVDLDAQERAAVAGLLLRCVRKD